MKKIGLSMKHIIVKRLGKIWNICNKRRIKKLEIERNQQNFCREINIKISTQNLTVFRWRD
jgi:hypothetical protein